MTAQTTRTFWGVFDRPWKVGVAATVAACLVVAALFSLRPGRPADYVQPDMRPAASSASSATTTDQSTRAIYVPVYSHVYYGGGRPHLMAVTLSIRNLEVRRAVRVHSVKYYDTAGQFIRSFIKAPIEIDALGTVEYLVPQDDISGGSGANFVVTWTPLDPDSREPLIQAVMVGRDGDRSFSFICTGVPIEEVPGKAVPAMDAASRQGDD